MINYFGFLNTLYNLTQIKIKHTDCIVSFNVKIISKEKLYMLIISLAEIILSSISSSFIAFGHYNIKALGGFNARV